MANYTYNPNTDYQAEINRAVADRNYTQAAILEQQRNAKIDGEGITDYAKTNDYAQYLQTAKPVSGYTYDANTNYQQQINDAVARGDYYAAAIAEQQRNAKIYGEGIGDYNQTNLYASYLPGGANYAQGQVANLPNGGAGMTTEQLQQMYLDIAANGGGTATSQADYINAMYDAAAQQAQAQLEQNYAQQVAGFDRLERENNQAYHANVNQAIADSARAQRSFAETSNAYGLSSGAAAQSALSLQNQSTNNVNNLRAAQQTAQQEISLQRETARTQYEAAIREALAENDYQRAQALYNEAVRVDDSLVSQGQNASSAILNYLGTILGYNREDVQNQYEQQLAAAEYAAALGDYSLMGQLYGWSQEQIDRLNNSWALQNPVKSYSGGSGGGSGGGSYSGGSGGGSGDGTTGAEPVSPAILQQINMNRTGNGQRYTIASLYESGQITQAQATQLGQQYGMTQAMINEMLRG